jgi:carboxymethylenebutenolidase
MPQIETSTVSIPRADGKGSMESFYAKPAGDSITPGVVVIHEAFGLNENIRQVTTQFAEQGYAALAVDLFSKRNRVICMMQAFHGILVRPYDLNSTMAFLRKQRNVDQHRIGAAGFCMGGSYALQLAVTDKGMKAASVFYGMNPKPLDALAQACPIVGNYPDKDFTTQAARELEAELTRHNIPHDIKIYGNTKHSFVSQQRTPVEVAATEDAWQRMLSFFGEHLN